MESNRMMGKIFHFAEKVMRIAQFQLLWVVFSLCGGVVLGIMPATAGLYTVLRKWMQGNDEQQSYVKVYWAAFRKEFWKANVLGLILTIIGFLIYLNFSLIRLSQGVSYWLLLIFLFMLSILFFILLLYIFPVYVHLETKFRRYFSLSILIGIAFPFHTLLMVIGYYVIYLLFINIPGLIPFFGISLFSTLSMWVSMKVFNSMEQTKESDSMNKQLSLKGLFQRNLKPVTNNK
ncbi:YesL family protein [Neobacillus niacini]|uniref:YesL family protein n=1 Tax=Neobacillus niacini TaxID=86668 RepID=UPI002FFE9D22